MSRSFYGSEATRHFFGNERLSLYVSPADAQEKWVEKYRGILNNYIAKEGHDFTALSKAYDARRREREGERK